MATEYIKTIECPKCRFKNVAGTKFCGDCGTALGGSPIPCGTCGTENPSGTKFCGNCGSNLQNPQENDPDVRHLQDALRGKYVVQKPLGEGGFGRVFLAEHSGLGQKHVIKLLSADSSRSTDIRNRFFQEAQLIARLNHPNIVPIMDVAEYLGRPYYIMKYLNGGSLEDLLIKEKKLPTEKALEITSKILSALSEVHSKGIIHRDLKPNNVLLDESGEPILIDFGIARVEEGGKAKTGSAVIGTLAYMSHEQLDASPITFTTDIYSTGIVLFELLTGKPPFEGSMSSLITQHNTAKLPSVSGKIDNSKLADGIQIVLQKACAKEPSARYGSAKEMREAVLGLIQAKPKPNPEWEKMEAEHKRREEALRKKEEELQARERVVVQERKVEVVKATPVLENPSSSKTYTNSLGMEFVLIPAGEFMMGAVPQDKEALDSEKPQHKVRITKPFYIGKYPVTQGEWEKLMGNNLSYFQKVMGKNPSYFQNAGKRAPVENVSWRGFQYFIKELNLKEGMTYRLPTEAEWEYAARGGSTGSPTGSYVYTFGDDAGKLSEYAWFDKNSGSTTHPVGQKRPNAIGLYDMMGNVWEWCEDWFDENYYKNSPSADPKGAEKGGNRSLRGGDWNYYAGGSRLSFRGSLHPADRNPNCGFRLVLHPEWEKMEAEHKRREEELRKKEEELQARERVVVQERKVEVVKATPVLENPSSSKTYTNSLGMEFVLIPAGEFLMGAVPQDKEALDNEKPQYKVRITKPFYIGKYPVTQGEWEKVMGSNPSYFKETKEGIIFKKIKNNIDHPVDSVSWNDCQEFIKKLCKKEGKTYRLPTEAEWEYAARGGGSVSSPTIYTYGDDAGKLGEYVWYDENSGRTTHPVGQKEPNLIDLYDMIGNVWEWCEDWYDGDYYKNSPSADPKGAEKGESRVLRGGSWADYARDSRVSNRNFKNLDIRRITDGFRLLLLP